MRNSYRYKILFIIIILLSSSFIYSCMPNGEKKLNKGIELFNKGETEKAVPYIEEGIVITSSLKKIDKNNFLYGGDALYFKDKKACRIVWPVELNIDITEDYSIVNYFPEAKKIGISNGFEIKLFNIEAKLIKVFGQAKDDEPGIKAFTNIDNNVYYFKDKKLYVYNLLTDNQEFFSDDKFYKPFTNETYNVEFDSDNNILAMAIGVAGKYNLDIIDLSNNSVIQRNVKITSSKFFLKNDIIYYISGDAGIYTLNKADVRFKRKEKKINFENLIDIEFFNDGVVFEEKDGMWISNLEGEERQKILFNYALAGNCGNNPVFKYNNAYFVMDMDKFQNQLKLLKESIPAFFNN